MRNKLLGLAMLCLLAMACNKSTETTVIKEEALSTKSAEADLLYHYKGQTYGLFYQEGSTEAVIEDDNYYALQTATAQRNIVTFTFNDKPSHHFYLFDSEWEGYDYMEQHDASPFIGRKFKVSLRIDELRTALMAQFGEPLDFKNTAVATAAQQGVEALYEELHINTPFPSNLAAFLGIATEEFKRPKSPKNLNGPPVLSVWEHSNAGGSVLYVEQGTHTYIINYGDYDCFTMASNPNLTIENKPINSDWNDCISSQCLSYIQGAEAMGVGYYKDTHFGVYSNGYRILIYRANGTIS